MNPLNWLTRVLDYIQLHPTGCFQIAVICLLAVIAIRLGRLVAIANANTRWRYRRNISSGTRYYKTRRPNTALRKWNGSMSDFHGAGATSQVVPTSDTSLANARRTTDRDFMSH